MENESLEDFKTKVKQWLTIDGEINKYESKIKELKKHKKSIRTRNYIIYGES